MEKNTEMTYAHVQSLDKSIGKFKMADNKKPQFTKKKG